MKSSLSNKKMAFIVLSSVACLVVIGTVFYIIKNSQPTKQIDYSANSNIKLNLETIKEMRVVSSINEEEKVKEKLIELLPIARKSWHRKVTDNNDGTKNLWIDDEIVFKGFGLDGATQSENGILALSSYDSAERRIEQADIVDTDSDGVMIGSIASIWLIDINKKAIHIGPQNMHSRGPHISPDGTKLAFQGEILDAIHCPGLATLYVLDLETRELWRGPSAKCLMGSAVPILWDEDSKGLSAFIAEFEGPKTIEYLTFE